MREKKETGFKKQKEASDKVNTHIELKSTMFQGVLGPGTCTRSYGLIIADLEEITYTPCLKKTTMMQHTITSKHINRFW